MLQFILVKKPLDIAGFFLFILIFAGCNTLGEPRIIRPKDYNKLPPETLSPEQILSFPWGWAVWTLMLVLLIAMIARTGKDIIKK